MAQLSHPEHQFVEPPTGPLPAPAVLELLDELLAAERAGVRVAAALRDDHPPGRLRTVLDVIRVDEAESCRLLAGAVVLLGGAPGVRVGEFAGKVLALDEPRARLELLQRGQRWVVRRLEEALPRIAHPEIAAALREVLTIHRRSVAACEAVLAQPHDAAPPRDAQRPTRSTPAEEI